MSNAPAGRAARPRGDIRIPNVELPNRECTVIAGRIIAVAEADQSQRIAAFYGYIDVAPLKRALEAKGYRVKVLEDLR